MMFIAEICVRICILVKYARSRSPSFGQSPSTLHHEKMTRNLSRVLNWSDGGTSSSLFSIYDLPILTSSLLFHRLKLPYCQESKPPEYCVPPTGSEQNKVGRATPSLPSSKLFNIGLPVYRPSTAPLASPLLVCHRNPIYDFTCMAFPPH